MKKFFLIFFLVTYIIISNAKEAKAQCSICTKTASQLGEKPAQGLNSGILYLMFTPLAIAGFLGFRWWKKEKEIIKEESNNIS